MTSYHEEINALSHEIWAVAQLAPGEGIADGAARIEAILRREIHSAITHCDRCGCSWLDDGVNPIGCPYCEHIDWRAVNAELLPLPGGEASSFGNYEVHDNEAMVAFARANVARAVTPLQAEIEALRAEVERLRSMTAMTMGIGKGDGNLFVHGDCDSIKAAQSLVFSAERMEKALKDIRSLSSINSAMNPNSFALTASYWPTSTILPILRWRRSSRNDASTHRY